MAGAREKAKPGESPSRPIEEEKNTEHVEEKTEIPVTTLSDSHKPIPAEEGSITAANEDVPPPVNRGNDEGTEKSQNPASQQHDTSENGNVVVRSLDPPFPTGSADAAVESVGEDSTTDSNAKEDKELIPEIPDTE